MGFMKRGFVGGGERDRLSVCQCKCKVVQVHLVIMIRMNAIIPSPTVQVSPPSRPPSHPLPSSRNGTEEAAR